MKRIGELCKMRDKKVDICKGIGVLLMVLGHAGMPNSTIIFRFHMALFFILSGFLFNRNKINDIRDLGKYIVKKIKTLYLPFVFWNGLIIVLNNFLINIGIYTDNPMFLNESGVVGDIGNWHGIRKILSANEIINALKQVILFKGEQQLGGATWFLRVMFGVNILWVFMTFVAKLISKNSLVVEGIVHSFVALGLLALSNMYQTKGINGLAMQFETVASSYIMYYIGYCYKHWKQGGEELKRTDVMIFIFCVICLFCCDRVCGLLGWNSNINYYNDWTMYITSSISGFFSIYFLAKYLSSIKNKVAEKIVDIIAKVGEKSIYVLILHFLAFKFVTAIQLIIYHQPLYRLASFPCFTTGGIWWIAYAFIGTVVPVIFGIGVERIKKRLKP